MANKKAFTEEKDKTKNGFAAQEQSAEDVAEDAVAEGEIVEEDPIDAVALKAEMEKLQNYVLRTKADMENIKKRNQNLAEEMYQDGKTETLTLLLPVIDSLDRALAMELTEREKEGYAKIKKLFDDIIAKLGVNEIEAEGKEFDPRVHNAMMQIEDETNSGKVVQVYQKGYRYQNKILRHASVVVAK